MAMDLNGFDANEVEPSAPREPIPAGWYKAVIVESEEKPTKAQTGSYLQLTLEIIEGEKAGLKFFDLLNLNNPNETTVDFARRTLSRICRAVGVNTPRNSSDLHDKPLMAKIRVKPAKDGYEPSNAVSEYAPVQKGAAATASSESGAAGKATPPWKRG